MIEDVEAAWRRYQEDLTRHGADPTAHDRQMLRYSFEAGYHAGGADAYYRTVRIMQGSYS